MASLLLGAPPMATVMAMATVPKSFTLSPSLSFSRSRSVVAVALTASTAPLSSSASSSAPPLIYCGRGDKKTARGKRFKHSFGNARPRNKKKGRGPPRVPTPPAPPRKDPFEDDELIEIEIDENLFSG